MLQSLQSQIMNKKNIFCPECGMLMDKKLIGAEQGVTYDWGDRNRLTTPYDPATGKRQYITRYTCPNRKWMFSKHLQAEDNIIVTNIK